MIPRWDELFVFRICRLSRLCGLCFGLQWQAGADPRIVAALQRPGIPESVLMKHLRQTGARGFVGSSAVSHYRFIARDAGQSFIGIVQSHPDCPGSYVRCFAPGARVADIDDCEFLAGIHSLYKFVSCDAETMWHKNLTQSRYVLGA